MILEMVIAIVIIILVRTLAYWKKLQIAGESDDDSEQDTNVHEKEKINRRCTLRFTPPNKQTGRVRMAEVSKQGYDPFERYKEKIKQERESNQGVWCAVGTYLNKIQFWQIVISIELQ